MEIIHFLQTFSKKDWRKYCLAHLFTYQDFADGVIGLAYVGNPKRNAVGGICTESNYYKFYSSISSVATSNFPSFIPAHLRPVAPPHRATPSVQYSCDF